MSKNHFRWNIEETDFGFRVCRGDHDRSEKCEWEYFYEADLYLRLKQDIRNQNKRIEELEAECEQLGADLNGTLDRAVVLALTREQLGKRIEELEATIERVRGLPEKWRKEPRISSDKAGVVYTRSAIHCANELEAELND